jgi:DNA ligase-associated metallophosphoesterase
VKPTTERTHSTRSGHAEIAAPIGAAPLDLAGQTLWLLPDRAVWWPAQRTLFVADVHLGKDAAFRAAGVPVPAAILERDLERLSSLIDSTGAASLVVLGDLMHARSGLCDHTVPTVARWRASHTGLHMRLVIGNHDRSAGRTPTEWRIETAPEGIIAEPFVLLHDPDGHAPEAEAGIEPEAVPRCALAGHVHPAVHVPLGAGRSRQLLPAFVLRAGVLILPAFGGFTGRAAIDRRNCDLAYVIADGETIELPGRRTRQ